MGGIGSTYDYLSFLILQTFTKTPEFHFAFSCFNTRLRALDTVFKNCQDNGKSFQVWVVILCFGKSKDLRQEEYKEREFGDRSGKEGNQVALSYSRIFRNRLNEFLVRRIQFELFSMIRLCKGVPLDVYFICRTKVRFESS